MDDDSKLTLHGLQQHYVKLKDNEKNRKMFDLLDALEFNQVQNLAASEVLQRPLIQFVVDFEDNDLSCILSDME